ncbi:MAG: methyltransferase domain-containing protein [Geobacteraceae bacterium]|nr:methyltransferase domain-containing protein [Geobacteraceae bacterium]
MEHVLEHVPFSTGVFFLREARRVLMPGGVIRIAMPDLDDLIDGYQNDWRRFDWVNWPAHHFIQTRAEMINIAFRWWGHQHLYNREELERALHDAGFRQYSFRQPGESDFPDLCGLETRPESTLIVDAVKS